MAIFIVTIHQKSLKNGIFEFFLKTTKSLALQYIAGLKPYFFLYQLLDEDLTYLTKPRYTNFGEKFSLGIKNANPTAITFDLL